MNTIQAIFSPIGNGNAGTCTTGGGVRTFVSFAPGVLTIEELEYVRLVSHTDFFQLVRTAFYMNEGLTFREATKKYLLSKRA